MLEWLIVAFSFIAGISTVLMFVFGFPKILRADKTAESDKFYVARIEVSAGMFPTEILSISCPGSRVALASVSKDAAVCCLFKPKTTYQDHLELSIPLGVGERSLPIFVCIESTWNSNSEISLCMSRSIFRIKRKISNNPMIDMNSPAQVTQ